MLTNPVLTVASILSFALPYGHMTFLDAATKIKTWGRELGFQQIGISEGNLGKHLDHLRNFLAKNRHGAMHYLEKNQTQREDIASLWPGTLRVISARMDYLPPHPPKTLENKNAAFISSYALGRDYHKLLRKRLSLLAKKIQADYPECQARAFTDSAPVLEKALAEKAGLGWIGKHTNLIHPRAGSWFFLGELYVNLELPIDTPAIKNHCGSCTACMNVCPTKAIVAPYELDARLCISYLTIELKESIPETLRPLIGNRIYGCDDCQLICPWNKFAKVTAEKEFHARHGLDDLSLIAAFAWSSADFTKYTEGSAMRRIGYEQWLRNVAVAMGNSNNPTLMTPALSTRLNDDSELVREHVIWALNQLQKKEKYHA